MIHDTGINCRLPQIPKSPSAAAAAAHYFDSIFFRSFQCGRTKPRTRRSSTTRSCGNRSTFSVSTNSNSGAGGDADDADEDENGDDGDDTQSVTSSVATDDVEGKRRKSEIN